MRSARRLALATAPNPPKGGPGGGLRTALRTGSAGLVLVSALLGRTADAPSAVLPATASTGRAAAAQEAERAFVSRACHIAFRHPADWVVRPDTIDPEDRCHFIVRPAAWDSLIVEADSIEDAYTVRVAVTPRSIDESMAGPGPFERRDSGWVVLGRAGLEAPAHPIRSDAWRGLRGLAPFGCYRIGGGYQGTCSFPVALVGTRRYSARLDGDPVVQRTFERILATLRFTEESPEARPVQSSSGFTVTNSANTG